MSGYANNHRDSRFFTGDKSELQEIKNKESLQKYVRHNKTRKNLSKLTYILIFCSLFALFATVCLAVFFKIETVEVLGTTRYSADEIRELCGIENGKSLYEIGSSDLAVLPQKLAYIRSARITRKLPDTLIITVTEDEPEFYTELYGEYFVLSDELRVLDRYFDSQTPVQDGLIELVLPEIDSCIVGQQIGFTYESDKKYVTAYLTALDSSILYERVTAFDLRDKFALSMICNSIYLIEYAGGDDLPTKLSAAAKVLENEKFDGKTPAKIDVADPAEISVIISPSVEISFSS